MNIYEKLQAARVDLCKSTLKKSGQNTFAKYEYFELGDFIPRINEILLERKMTSTLLFDEERATLTIFDAEKPEDCLVFTCPMSSADLKGTHAVQNLGAVMTYLRRYLWMNAFEIVEHDALDKGQAEKKPAPQQQQRPAQTQQAQPKNGGQQSGVLCAECNAIITEHTTQAGKVYSAEKLIEWSTRDYKEPLCHRCSSKRKFGSKDLPGAVREKRDQAVGIADASAQPPAELFEGGPQD
jgi:hypothetical protein